MMTEVELEAISRDAKGNTVFLAFEQMIARTLPRFWLPTSGSRTAVRSLFCHAKQLVVFEGQE